ncbi:formyltransferase family protein [Sedimenticola hydrogenitrophicus]|uniref:formyltransferase family protein n=1 Tax=Sedimenticola hydrogenitrophicus TaxID=2967975 RepID=UPI0021A74651|nr:formyltransferase family protein [Sedimenticola hydrogenitrophicus]
MKQLRAVLLMSETSCQKTLDAAKEAGIDLDFVMVGDLEALESAFAVHRDLLLSFGMGTIVPRWILDRPSLIAFNVHAASPQYPGRDPHHFAVYDEAKEYGATLHYMTQSVDAGPIVDVEIFDVPPAVTPSALLDLSRKASFVLIKRFFQQYVEYGAPKPMGGIVWGGCKSTRKMFLELCRIDPAMTKEEIERRKIATEMPGYKNLYVDIHGYRFRIEDL